MAVIGFSPVVRVPLDVVPGRRNQPLDHCWVDGGSVGDHLAGSALPVLVDRPVDVAPHPVDLDVALVDEPAVARRVTAEPRGVGQQRGEPLYPPEDGDVVDLDSAFDQQLLRVPVRQAVAQVPADRDHDHLSREPEPANADLGGSQGRGWVDRFTDQASPMWPDLAYGQRNRAIRVYRCRCSRRFHHARRVRACRSSRRCSQCWNAMSPGTSPSMATGTCRGAVRFSRTIASRAAPAER